MSILRRPATAILLALVLGTTNLAGRPSVAAARPTSRAHLHPGTARSAKPLPPAFPVTLVDALSHRITLTRPPQRIVSLGPSVTETLFAIGAGPRVVADTSYDDYPAAARKLPKIGGFINPSAEKILSFHPDLVIAVRGNSADLLKTLDRVHVRVFAIDPESVAEVISTVRTLGRLTGVSARAEGVARGMEGAIARVRRALRSTHAAPLTSLIVVGHQPLFAAGPRSFVSDVLRIAGGANAAPANGPDYPQLSDEAVLALRPQSIFLAETGLTVQQALQWPGWAQLPAAKQRRIFWIDGNLITRPAPRVVLALEEMARDLHPGVFR